MKRVLDDLSVFCAVVEKGSLKQASELLGIPHSTVSRRIDALESALGLHLLHRTTREVKATSRGMQLYQDSAPLLESLASSVELAISSEVAFKGSLSVSMPVRAGLDFLGDWLIDFASQHEDLTLDLSMSNVNLNLIQENIDLAFRVGPIGRFICSCTTPLGYSILNLCLSCLCQCAQSRSQLSITTAAIQAANGYLNARTYMDTSKLYQ